MDLSSVNLCESEIKNSAKESCSYSTNQDNESQDLKLLYSEAVAKQWGDIMEEIDADGENSSFFNETINKNSITNNINVNKDETKKMSI